VYLSASQILAILGSDRFSAFPARDNGPGWIEISLANGSLALLFPEIWTQAEALDKFLVRSRAGYAPVVLFGDDGLFAELHADRLLGQGEVSLEILPLSGPRLHTILTRHEALLKLRRHAAEEEMVAERLRSEIDSLNAIGRALASERDIGKLLAVILERSRHVTDADAGSIYVVEGDDDDDDDDAVDGRRLRFKVSQNDSVALDFTEFTLPVSRESIVGRCVLERTVVNIGDLYSLDPSSSFGFRHNRDFDERSGYETHSMLAVPMIDHRGRVIGVIQLINRKRRPEAVLAGPDDFARWVVPFVPRAEVLAAGVAAQAGIALENAMLYDEIRRLFESFVDASVTAIEQRDPTTSGHSRRVADLTVGLARTTERSGSGRYAGYRAGVDELKQIEYAALLHDFGKVGVREHVLVKAKKLYDHERELLLLRFDFLRRDVELDIARKKLEASGAAAHAALDAELAARIAELDSVVRLCLEANEPSLLGAGGFERLADLGARTYHDARGEVRPWLTPREIEALQIRRGSLTGKEREEIESHVSLTYEFLCRIPWGRTLRNVPEYAGSHHEKLDGSGYPHQLPGAAIPIPARMMTICDIYDALTASDRPYKRAVPVDKALDIIASEVKAGKCDGDLFRIFVDGEVWKLAHGGSRSA